MFGRMLCFINLASLSYISSDFTHWQQPSCPLASCFCDSCSNVLYKSTSLIKMFVQSSTESMLEHSNVRGKHMEAQLHYGVHGQCRATKGQHFCCWTNREIQKPLLPLMNAAVLRVFIVQPNKWLVQLGSLREAQLYWQQQLNQQVLFFFESPCTHQFVSPLKI